ncbi:MAG: DUF362 domain-containing protein [Methanolinea sp.]|nr:DUF362 domain-containing protein [Methanolinea sp.]
MDGAIVQSPLLKYPHEAPFHPSCKYPEYSFQNLSGTNAVYESVRTLLFRLGLDTEHYNTEDWNPLGSIIFPGDTVVIKPNLVRHYNPLGSMDAMITHGSIIRAILDYVYIALKGKGTITIGDAPIQSCNFEKVIEIAGLDKIVEYYQKNTAIKINLVDFRKSAGYPQKTGLINRIDLPGDPKGYTLVNLGQFSEFYPIQDDFDKFRVTNYDKEKMRQYHNVGDHYYLIANSVLHADVVINLPKLKTHRKAGMTGSLKNIVGIIGSKDCLPHHRSGSQEEGGDEYLHRDFRKRLITGLHEHCDTSKNPITGILGRICQSFILGTQRIIPPSDKYFEGSWYGNTTIPRTIMDLNKIILFVDKNGVLKDNHQRRTLTIVDAIIAGEKEGPLNPSPKHIGTLIAGENPVIVDLICSQIMGYDYWKIPTLKNALTSQTHCICKKNIDELQIQADEKIRFENIHTHYGHHFTPASGWKGHIEHDNLN